MKVQVEDVTAVEKRLSIEVDPAYVDKELTLAYAALAQQVKMPGFRPGKVPRRLLEKHYRAEVEADVVKRVQLSSLIDALRQHEVQAVGEPHFSGGKLEPQKPYAYTARVEVKPALAPKDYKGLQLAKVDDTVGDAQVQAQLDRLRDSRATVVPVTDRDVVALGDLVKVDFEALVEGQGFPGSSGKDVTLEVTEGAFHEGHVPGLAGAKIGAATDLEAGFPADYQVEQVKGKVAKVSATVKSIQQRQVPALDDAFAQSVGIASLEALTARMRDDLSRAKKREVAVQEREAIFQKLAEKNPVEVPGSLVQRGVDAMLENALGSMARSGMDLRSLNLDWQKLRDDLKPRAESEVKGQLLLEAIAKAEQLSVTDDEVEAKLVALAEENGVPVTTVKKQYAQDEAKTGLRSRILDEKVLDFLKANATYA
jgi:trigger factor